MEVRVLGCHGGESPQHLPTSLLVDGHLALDAGSVCRSLSLEAQLQIEEIIIGHAHMDHIKDLALLAEQGVGRRTKPIDVHCGPDSARALKQHFFNDVVWPDFTVLPSKSKPMVRLRTERAARKFKACGLDVTMIPVHHPVESMGMLVQQGQRAFVYSSDTGPTDKLWKAAAKVEGLAAVFLELSFPNSMQALADKAGHLTPYSLALELQKLPDPAVPVFLYHLKPSHTVEIRRELRALRRDNLSVLSPGDVIEI
ncbi:MAG: 3',5'-cyclic-nucleotide phosphodiesterase [Pseudomonadota bacterium]